MATYLITGAAGFIGSHLALGLAKSGANVRVLDNFSSGLSRTDFEQFCSAYSGNIEIVDGDIRDIAICRSAVTGVTHVLHHAAISSALRSIEDPVETMSVNIVGTANLLAASRDSGTVERFINASSCAVYGDGSSSAKSESAMLFPGSPFATSMQAAESLCVNYFKSYKFCAGSVRYFNVDGPSEMTWGNPRSAVAKFIQALQNHQDVTVHGSGDQTRDFIHIDDVVSALIKLCNCESRYVGGQVYNIGTGERVSVLDLLDMIGSQFGGHIDCVSVEPPPHEMKHSKADTVKASAILGFNADISLEAGIREMIAAVPTVAKLAA